MPTTAAYGSWRSPITGDLLVEQVVAPSQVITDGDDIYWNERRPDESGRQVIVKMDAGGTMAELLPMPYSARTTVHEYGGQSFAVHGGVVVFSNFADQRLYRIDPTGEITVLTEEPERPCSIRYADHVITPDGRTVICVRERHGMNGIDGALGVVNDLVALPLNGPAQPSVLAQGNDFYLAPRLSPDGSRLAFVTWNHPNMPWDGTELLVLDLNFNPAPTVRRSARICGGEQESISQPRFAADGTLVYLSDRSGYWNLYNESGAALFRIEAECGGPDWVFGQSSYVLRADGSIVVSYTQNARNQLAIIHQGVVRELEHRLTNFSSLACTSSGSLVALGGSANDPLAVVRIDVADGVTNVVRRSRALTIDPGYLSTPRHVAFPTAAGDEAYALYYPPKNRDFQGSPGERPPLIVQSHGGPTASARQIFDPEIQFWTSRGFAVVDVDYGGSSGYGRAYRERLNGRWGVVDVDDCAHAALHLANRGRVDRRHMVIHGGSAGGYTTLACLAFRHVFAAGASYFGVSDLAALAADTHKFESRYLDRLIGPYPEAREVYEERSPLAHADELKVPVIFFQGLDDRVVPPNQAQMMFDALHVHGIPAALLTFAGEGHGFRGAHAITRSIEAELYFYARVLGLAIADTIEPVTIADSSLLIH